VLVYLRRGFCLSRRGFCLGFLRESARGVRKNRAQGDENDQPTQVSTTVGARARPGEPSFSRCL